MIFITTVTHSPNWHDRKNLESEKEIWTLPSSLDYDVYIHKHWNNKGVDIVYQPSKQELEEYIRTTHRKKGGNIILGTYLATKDLKISLQPTGLFDSLLNKAPWFLVLEE